MKKSVFSIKFILIPSKSFLILGAQHCIATDYGKASVHTIELGYYEHSWTIKKSLLKQ